MMKTSRVHFRLLVCVALCCATLVALQAQAGNPPPLHIDEKAVDAAVQEALSPRGPGYAVLIVQGSKVLYQKGFGFADIRQQTRIDAASTFDLASVSKHITAAAILKLVQQGKLSIDDSLAQFFPGWKGPVVTVKHLLSHSSGLADYTSDDFEGSEEEFAKLNTTTHLAWIQRQQPHSRPGERYEYNNSGYALLATIVEKVSGMSFATFVQRELFAPLGMKNSLVYDRLGLSVPKRVTGYIAGTKGWELSRLDSAITGDGNVFTSIADLALWEAGWWTDKIVPRNLRNLAWTALWEDEDNGAYAWGLELLDDDYGPAVAHSGSWMGTATYLYRNINKQLSVVVIANDEEADVEGLCEALVELVLE